MGNSRVNHVFDEVALNIMKLIETKQISTPAARGILITLIAELQDEDWDTEYESLERFGHVPVIVEAFEFRDVLLDEDDDEDEDGWDDEDDEDDEDEEVTPEKVQ